LAFTPDGASLFAVTKTGSILHWSVHTGALRQKIAAGALVRGRIFALSGGRLLYHTSAGIPRIARQEGGAPIRDLGDLRRDGILAVDRAEELAATFTLKLIRLADGKPRGAIKESGRTLLAIAHDAVALSARGLLAAGGWADGTLRVFSVASAQRLAMLRPHAGLVTSVAFSPDGRLLATGGQDGAVHVWEVDRLLAGGPPGR